MAKELVPHDEPKKIITAHYYPFISITIKGIDEKDSSSISIEAPTELFHINNVGLTKNTIEVASSCLIAPLCQDQTHKPEKYHGLLRYYGLSGELFEHLVFSTSTDMYVWDIPYSIYVTTIPPNIRSKLNRAETYALDQFMKGIGHNGYTE